jgi:glucosamine--fructose-6-phosphate aminotransferase (isomerizing)
MCGIIGIRNEGGDVVPWLVEGLRRVEYRGYDSAGVATLVEGHIERRRAQGKIDVLEQRLAEKPLSGAIGIGHTRWATHGLPIERNAHPIATARVAVVHNGIIENFQVLKRELEALGHVFETETDTEVVTVLVTSLLEEGASPLTAVARTLGRLEGSFALVFLFADEDDLLIGARRGSPLAIGYGASTLALGSDALALASCATRVSYLAEGDIAVLAKGQVTISDAAGAQVERLVVPISKAAAGVGKGRYAHFMLKEIYEQPRVIGETLAELIEPATRTTCLPAFPFELGALTRATIIACGTSYHAACVMRYWLEKLARIPADVDVASEFRYRAPPMQEGGVAIFISQSGETADTLAALRYAKEAGQHIIAIVNQPGSSIAREADIVLSTLAGPEIGVASTKAFTTQLAVLAVLSVAIAEARGALSREHAATLLGTLLETPALIEEVLGGDEHISRVALWVERARDVLYLGRGTAFPLALEGALKLKEISYIHAEGYAAGEMKHGPIALIASDVPIVVIAPRDGVLEKTLSNVEEALARDGRVVLISDAEIIARFEGRLAYGISMPRSDPFIAPLLYAIPVQLLAYYAAVVRGTDVDQPRNLAKSVTVE